MYIYTHLYVYAGTICIHMLSATVTFTQTHHCDITSKQGQGGKLGHGGLWKICWIQEFSCWSTHEVTPNEESCNSRTQGSPNMSCSSPKFIFQLPGLPGSGWEDEAKSNFLLTLVRCLILRSPAGGTQLSVKQVGYGWRVAFFCADCLILVLMYWTIRFFFFVASTPTQLAQLSNHVILFGYTNHTYRERRMCLSNSQLGGEKNYYPRMKQKFCFDWFPWCYNFPAHHACKVMQMVFGHFLVMQLLISPVAPLLQFVECEKLCLMWWNHAKTMKQPDSLG